MADITFNCPHCNQPVQCDDQWSGHEIQCPICQGALVVPKPGPAKSNSLVPRPPSGPAPKLSFQQNAQQPAAPSRSIPIRNLAPTAAKRRSPIVKLAVWAVVLIGIGAGVYLGWPLVAQWQERANAKRREAEKNSDGGEAGHIANLYNVLDATDPSNPHLERLGNKGGHATGPQQRDSGVPSAIPVPAGGTPGAAMPAAGAAVTPPVYTLEVAQAVIPDGVVNGVISGTKFVAELARMDAVGPAQVLRLTQGTPTAPDREILVYLHLKPGDTLPGHNWLISSDMKGAEVPQVIKRWTGQPGMPLQMKPLAYGYAMKLELGQLTNGAIPGKIFVALPDTERTVAAGAFNATTTLPEVITAAAPVVQPAAVAPPPGVPPRPTPASAEFDRRYGKTR
jgi:hypothetical protein